MTNHSDTDRVAANRASASREQLIAQLSDQTAPVRRVSEASGLAMIALAALAAGVASIALFGFWIAQFAGEASAFYWILNGLLLVLGFASAAALVSTALPRVGARSSGPKWSVAMLAVVPVAALVSLFTVDPAHGALGMHNPELHYWECAWRSLAAGLIVGLAGVLYLRRGAPVSLERSGWLTGLAAGSLGAFAYGITCPLDSLGHLGIIHVLPVAVSAVIGRLVVPPLIRW